MSGNHSGRNGERTATVELVSDIWLIIMSHLSPPNIVRLGQTCKTLREYSWYYYVWRTAFINHQSLPKSHPHLWTAQTSVIRRQLLTTARIDAAYSRGILKPFRSYSFSLDTAGTFKGMNFLPGGEWVVMMFHTDTPNPAVKSSSICLLKLPIGSATTTLQPTSVTLQSEISWSPLTSENRPYKSSCGNDLLLLRASHENEWTFAICHLDTQTPSIRITFRVNTTLRTTRCIAAGDYFVYGWLTDDRRHMLRIMKLNEDSTQLVNDVTVEIDHPGESEMPYYDLRLLGKQTRFLMISAQLMAAYDISDAHLTSGSQNSPARMQSSWMYVPEQIPFERILHVFHEGAIVIGSMYESSIQLIYPELDNTKPNSWAKAQYNLGDPILPNTTTYPAIWSSQRMFWPQDTARSIPKNETAMLPVPGKDEFDVGIALVDYEDLVSTNGGSEYYPLDWDELSGRYCVRYERNKLYGEGSPQMKCLRLLIMELA